VCKVNDGVTSVKIWAAVHAGSTSGGPNTNAIRAPTLLTARERRTHPRTKTPELVEQAIVTARRTLEAANTPETKYGLIGVHAVHGHLERLGIKLLPSDPTIQRIMARHDQTHPIGAGNDSAYYPWPIAWGVNAIHATDIITRYVHGGEEIDNFHTIG
jgi:hypothetical protein